MEGRLTVSSLVTTRRSGEGEGERNTKQKPPSFHAEQYGCPTPARHVAAAINRVSETQYLEFSPTAAGVPLPRRDGLSSRRTAPK